MFHSDKMCPEDVGWSDGHVRSDKLGETCSELQARTDTFCPSTTYYEISHQFSTRI